MNARCVPRARGIAFIRAVSPASPESSQSTNTSSPGCTCRAMLRSVRFSVFRPSVATMIERVGSPIEIRPRPELEVQRPPELHPRRQLAAAVPVEAPPRGGGVDEPTLSEGLGAENAGRQLAQ